jgi:hypothetical protein
MDLLSIGLFAAAFAAMVGAIGFSFWSGITYAVVCGAVSIVLSVIGLLVTLWAAKKAARDGSHGSKHTKSGDR